MNRKRPNYLGLRAWVWNKTAKTFVGVYDGRLAQMDTDAGRWSTVCEKHGNIISHDTLKLALGHSHDVLGWCDDCREAVEPVVNSSELVVTSHHV